MKSADSIRSQKRERRLPTLSSLEIDATDLTMLEALQVHGRTKRNELAEKVHLSLPAVSERLRKLEERGVITGVSAKLDAKLLGLDVAAFIFATVESSGHYPAFLEKAAQNAEVQEVHAITGEGSHLLKIITWNTSTLERLLSEIQTWPGVKSTRTMVVLSTHKEAFALPINELQPEHTAPKQV